MDWDTGGFGLQKVQTWSTWSSTLPASMAMDRDLFLEICQICHPFFSGFQANHSRHFTYDMLKAASNLLFWWLRWMPEWMSVYHCKVTPFFFNWGLEENKDAACEFYLQNGFVLILKEAVLCKLKSWSILIWWFMLIQTLRGWAWITDFARSPTPYKT